MDQLQRRSTTRGHSSSGKRAASSRTSNVSNNRNGMNAQQRSIRLREANKYAPITNVSRIMRDVIPDRGRISDDAKETVQACVSEFIGHVTTVANQKCHSEYRKTISADDIISAMGTLGFTDYVEPLSVYLNKMRENDPNRNPSLRLPAGNSNASSGPPNAHVAQPSALQGYVLSTNNGSTYYMGNGGGNEGGSSSNFGYDPYWQFK